MTGLVFETFDDKVIYHRIGGGYEVIGATGASNDAYPTAGSQNALFNGAFSNFVGGADLISWNGLIFFDGLDSVGTSTLEIFNPGTTTVEGEKPNTTTTFEYSPQKVWGNTGLSPQDFVGSPTELYFLGLGQSPDGAPDRNFYLWQTDGSFSGTHQVAGSPIDNGQMAMYQGDLYFSGQDWNSGQTGLYELVNGVISTVAGTTGMSPMQTMSATVRNGAFAATDLFFNNAGSLYSFNGSGGPSQFGASGIDPRDIQSLTFGGNGIPQQSELVFNGADSTSSGHAGPTGGTGGRGLFTVSESSSGLKVNEVAATAGLNPQDLTILDGEVYFAAADKGNPNGGEGLWVYSPADKTSTHLTEIFSSSQYNLNFNGGLNETLTGGPLTHPQAQITTSGGELFFSARDAVQNITELYDYNPATGHLSMAAYQNPYNLAAVG